MSKVAIISDSHDNLPRINQMLEMVKKENINTIIHCGDVCTTNTLDYFCQNFDGNIYLSMGNVDHDHKINKEIKNLKIFSKFGDLKINNLNIAFTHYPKKAKELALTEKYNFIFYGHTHQPWEENINSTKIINPGTLAGIWNRSTFAILDTTLPAGRQENKNVELIIL